MSESIRVDMRICMSPEEQIAALELELFDTRKAAVAMLPGM